MGCFLGCFGGAKEQRRRKKRVNREKPRRQRSHDQSVQQGSVLSAEHSATEVTPLNLDLELSKSEVIKEPSPSPKKRVTFNSNITTYEHVPVHESIESLPGCATNTEKEKENLNSEDDNSVISSATLYPLNHRYHNARDSDDEADEYGDSDLDDLDDSDDEDYFDDYEDNDVDIDVRSAGQEVWSQSIVTESTESRTGTCLEQAISKEVESVKGFTPNTSARDRSDYINSVLNPVANITQWRAAKSKGSSNLLKPQKENLTSNFDAPHLPFSSEPALGQPPAYFKSKADKFRKPNEEIAVDASLSTWLATPEMKASRKSNFSDVETDVSGLTISEGHTSFKDRPILGALTVEELKQISPSPSPRKSPCRSPDDTPIIGIVGTYWNHSGSSKCSGSSYSYRGHTKCNKQVPRIRE